MGEAERERSPSCAKPVLQALLLADYVYQDKETGKRLVAGIFDCILVKKHRVPTSNSGEPGPVVIPVGDVRQVGSPYIYINLREVRSTMPLELRLVHLESNEVFFRCSPFEVVCEDPLRSVELVIPVPMLPSILGTYAFELIYNNEMIGSHRFVVRETEQQE